MEHMELHTLLMELIDTWENEVIEFKQAGHDYSTDKIGQYFSALSNEANLRDTERAWLVFGVENKQREIIGTNYRPQSERLQSLKMQLAQNAEPSITFRNIYELSIPEGRVYSLKYRLLQKVCQLHGKGTIMQEQVKASLPWGWINWMKFVNRPLQLTGQLK